MLKNLLLKKRSAVFLVSESQLVHEKFLEDINSLLNAGEVHNLYPQDDKETLLNEVKDMTEK